MKNEGIIMKIFTTLVVVLLAIGCTQASHTDLEGLKAMRDVWQSAYDAKDSALIAGIYSENAAVMPPNSESVNGRAAIEDFFTEFHAAGMGVEIKDTEAHANGDVGYKVGTYTISDADGATVDEGKYVEIWRNIDGTWQMHRDIFNSNLPLSAPEAESEPSPDSEDEAEIADEA
jgi:ketosteroid isomerase-like protein